jgi:hypothetical protein
MGIGQLKFLIPCELLLLLLLLLLFRRITAFNVKGNPTWINITSLIVN